MAVKTENQISKLKGETDRQVNNRATHSMAVGSTTSGKCANVIAHHILQPTGQLKTNNSLI